MTAQWTPEQAEADLRDPRHGRRAGWRYFARRWGWGRDRTRALLRWHRFGRGVMP